MVHRGKSIANGSNNPQFPPIMCAPCARCARTPPSLCEGAPSYRLQKRVAALWGSDVPIGAQGVWGTIETQAQQQRVNAAQGQWMAPRNRWAPFTKKQNKGKHEWARATGLTEVSRYSRWLFRAV